MKKSGGFPKAGSPLSLSKNPGGHRRAAPFDFHCEPVGMYVWLGSLALQGSAGRLSYKVRAREHRCTGFRKKRFGTRLRGSASKIPAGGSASCTSSFWTIKTRLSAEKIAVRTAFGMVPGGFPKAGSTLFFTNQKTRTDEQAFLKPVKKGRAHRLRLPDGGACADGRSALQRFERALAP